MKTRALSRRTFMKLSAATAIATGLSAGTAVAFAEADAGTQGSDIKRIRHLLSRLRQDGVWRVGHRGERPRRESGGRHQLLHFRRQLLR